MIRPQLALCGLAAICLFCVVARANPPQRSFAEAERRHIDDNAVWSPREKLDPPHVTAPGSVLEWLVVHTPLPADEERRRAAEEHRQFVAKVGPANPSAPAQVVLDQLTTRVPARLRAWNDAPQLSTVDALAPNAQLVGGGQLFVDRAWLEAILAEPGAGRDQLAFTLANELGHACLGHARRRMQRMWLEEELRKDVERKGPDREKTLEILNDLASVGAILDQALETAILDGRGQMTFDLEPDSLFLEYLNRPRENLHRDRYVIHRGRAFTRTRALLLQAAVDTARAGLMRRLDQKKDSLLRKFGLAATDVLVLPPEIADGDMCVRSDSALLEGVERVTTHALKHTALPRDPEVISQIVRQLTSPP